jgi:hypothetical protein
MAASQAAEQPADDAARCMTEIYIALSTARWCWLAFRTRGKSPTESDDKHFYEALNAKIRSMTGDDRDLFDFNAGDAPQDSPRNPVDDRRVRYIGQANRRHLPGGSCR